MIGEVYQRWLIIWTNKHAKHDNNWWVEYKIHQLEPHVCEGAIPDQLNDDFCKINHNDHVDIDHHK